MGGRKKVVGVGVADPFMQPTYSAEGAGGGEQAAQSLIGRWRAQTTEYYSDYCSSGMQLLTAAAVARRVCDDYLK